MQKDKNPSSAFSLFCQNLRWICQQMHTSTAACRYSVTNPSGFVFVFFPVFVFVFVFWLVMSDVSSSFCQFLQNRSCLQMHISTFQQPACHSLVTIPNWTSITQQLNNNYLETQPIEATFKWQPKPSDSGTIIQDSKVLSVLSCHQCKCISINIQHYKCTKEAIPKCSQPTRTISSALQLNSKYQRKEPLHYNYGLRPI